MQCISAPKDIIVKILGEQKLNLKNQYRPFSYIKKLEVDDKILLYNLLTFEIVLLDNEEARFFTGNPDMDHDVAIKLAKKWFVVPEDHDDIQLVNQVEYIRTEINKIYTPPKFNNFTILPTTGCNARCFYCFEKGSKQRDMSRKTAEDVADYILKNKLEGKVFLRWFGGEPLYNLHAIDIICNKLKGYNIEYESYMITNGYLFDDLVVKKAVEDWKLKTVQITLDGTEKVYNRVKAYIYNSDTNPFKKVLYNIEILSKANVKIRIRLNLEAHNVEDLYLLIDQLADRFTKYDNIKVRTALLFEESCARMKEKQSQELKHALISEQAKLQEYAKSKGLLDVSTKVHSGHAGHCMADSNYCTTILPGGELGKCQSYLDGHFWGSIYDDKINFRELNWFKTTKTILRECDLCKYRPACVFPQCCITIPTHCDEIDKKRIEKNMDIYLNNLYKKFKNSR